MTRGWWIDALHIPQTAAVVAALGLAGLVAGAFLWWTRGSKQGEGPADVIVDKGNQGWLLEEDDKSSWKIARAGLLLMGAGTALIVGQWLMMHQAPPVGKISLSLHQSTEYYRAPMAAKSLKVMLPLRMTVTGAVYGEEPLVHVRFASPKKQDEAASQTMRPGESLDVGDLRFTFVGFTHAKSALRATIKGTGTDTIEVAGGVGDTIRVAIDGPEFEIVEIVADYMQALGPAVELHAPDYDSFWIFERAAAMADLDFGHGLELVDIQSVPAPVFSVAPYQSTWPLGAGGALFVAGLLAFFAAPQRRVLEGTPDQGDPDREGQHREREDREKQGEKLALSSLNEAGRLVDELCRGEEEGR